MEMKAIVQRPIVSEELAALREIDVLNAELRARNELRLAEVKIAMGTKYLLHPANAPKRNAHHNVLDRVSEKNDYHSAQQN